MLQTFSTTLLRIRQWEPSHPVPTGFPRLKREPRRLVTLGSFRMSVCPPLQIAPRLTILVGCVLQFVVGSRNLVGRRNRVNDVHAPCGACVGGLAEDHTSTVTTN